VFCDFTMPLWRLQACGVEDVVALRKQGHSGPSRVPRWRFDPTPTGFVLEFEEDWVDQDRQGNGRRWTARELARADIGEEGIAQFSVYCTGDWDEQRRIEHANAVTLIRP